MYLCCFFVFLWSLPNTHMCAQTLDCKPHEARDICSVHSYLKCLKTYLSRDIRHSINTS